MLGEASKPYLHNQSYIQLRNPPQVDEYVRLLQLSCLVFQGM